MSRIMLSLLSCALTLILAASRPAETVGTLTLDSLSFVSFQDQQVLPLASGSTLAIRFGDAAPDGSIPFTLSPSDVQIPPIPLPGGDRLIYKLTSPASGLLQPSAKCGRRMDLTVKIGATHICTTQISVTQVSSGQISA